MIFMRKFIVFLLSLLFFNSCYEPFGGSGVIIEEEYNIEAPCYIVEYNTLGKLYIIPSDEFKIIVKTDDNILPKIDIKKIGPRLRIDNKMDINPTILEFYVYIPDISEIEMNGSGDVIIDKHLNQGKSGFNLISNGSGDFKLFQLTTNYVDIILNGSGDAEIEDINLQDKLSIKLDGSGNINITSLIVPEVSVVTSGSGDIDFDSGTIDVFDIKLFGSGDVKSIDCVTKNAEIISDGSGDIYVYVTSDLNVNISGSGDVFYKGDPIINSNITGLGKLKKY